MIREDLVHMFVEDAMQRNGVWVEQRWGGAICLVQIQGYVKGVADCLSLGAVHDDGQSPEVAAVNLMLAAWGDVEGLANFGDLGKVSPGGLVIQVAVKALEVERISDIGKRLGRSQISLRQCSSLPSFMLAHTLSSTDSGRKDERVARRRCRKM